MYYGDLDRERLAQLLTERDETIRGLNEKLNRALERQEQGLQRILDSLPDMILQVDPEMRVVWANHVAQEKRPNVIGEFCHQAYTHRQQPCEACPCARALKTGRMEQGTVVLKDERGREHYWENIGIPMLDDNGAVSGMIEISREVTERELAKQRMEDYNRELLEARDMANAANQAKTDFLANTSHEIRTPMNGILGMIQLLEHSELDPKQRELLGYLRSASDRLMKVMDGILAISNLEHDEMQLIEEEFSFAEFFKNLVQSKEKTAIAKGLTLDYRIGARVPEAVIADKYRLTQILSNILDNSIKFSRIGNVDLSADAEIGETGQVTLILRISDTGIGIPEDKLESIFETFNQVDNSSTREFGGTGLGLSIAKRLTELMKGSVAVQSNYGVGTTFTVSIPVRISDFENRKILNTREQQEEAQTQESEPRSRRTYRILVAEDEVLGRITLKFMLKDRYEVIFAKNGRQAVDLYQETKPDLVLMDIMMPILNGFEAFDEIEKQAGGQRVPIIACTAKVIKTEKEYLVSYGFDDYISKPIDMKHLHQMLERHLNGAR